MSSSSRGRSEVSVDASDTVLELSTKSTSPEPDEAPGPWIWWSPHMRSQLELTFTMQTNFPIGQSWETTESYVNHKDMEMLRYINDFPIKKWIIPFEEALSAYLCLLERDRLRTNHQSIFANGRSSWWPLPQSRQPKSHMVASQRGNHLLASNRPFAGAEKNAGHTSLDHVSNAAALASRPRESAGGAVSTTSFQSMVRPQTYPNLPLSSQSLPPAVDAGTITVNSHHPHPTGRNMSIDTLAMPPPNDDARVRRGRATKTKAGSDEDDINIDGELSPEAKAKIPRISKYSAIRDVSPPPYQPRPRPSATKLAELGGKASRRESNFGFVKFYNRPEFPWHTEYSGENPKAWDDSIYPKERLDHIEGIQRRNAAIIAQHGDLKKGIDAADKETVKVRAPKEKAPRPKQKPKRRPAGAQAANFDPYHSGHLLFADDKSDEMATKAGFSDIRDALQAAMRDPFDMTFAQIEVITDPGDRIIPQLEVPRMSIMDIARTRLQLENCRVLPDLAAWRLIDYCPDMLFDYNLLKVIGETSTGNTLIQQRLATNGAMVSGSTITKRVTSAVERTKEGESKDEKDIDKEWRAQNRKEYNKYKSYHMARRARANGEEEPCDFDLAAASQRHIAVAPKERVQPREASSSPAPSTMTDISSRQSSVEQGDNVTVANGVKPDVEEIDASESQALSDVARSGTGKERQPLLPVDHPSMSSGVESAEPSPKIATTATNSKRRRTSDHEPAPASKRLGGIRGYFLPSGQGK